MEDPSFFTIEKDCPWVESETEAVIQDALKQFDEVESNFGANDPRSLDVQHKLGVTYFDINDMTSAIQTLSPCLDARAQILGVNHKDTLKTLLWLARAQKEEKNYDTAEAMFAQLVDLLHSNYGDCDDQVITAVYFLAVVYGNQGRHDQAIGVLNKFEASLISELREKHAFDISVVRRVADQWIFLGFAQRGVSVWEKCVEYHKSLGQRALEVESICHLGGARLFLDVFADPFETETMLKNCLEQCIELFGLDDARTWTTKHSLGTLYAHQLSRCEEAETLLKDCISWRKQHLGPKHTDTLLSSYELALTFHCNRRLEEAQVLYEDAYSLNSSLGPFHYLTLRAMGNFCNVLCDAGVELERADRLFHANQYCYQRSFGIEHSGSLDSIFKYFVSYVHPKVTNNARVLEILEDTIAMYSTHVPNLVQLVGEDNLSVLAITHHFGVMYNFISESTKALHWLGQSYRVIKRMLSSAKRRANLTILGIINDYANGYYLCKDYSNAIAIYSEMEQLALETYNDQHISYYLACAGQGVAYIDSQRPETAEPYIKKCIVYLETVGANDAQADAMTRSRMRSRHVKILEDLNRHTEAQQQLLLSLKDLDDAIHAKTLRSPTQPAIKLLVETREQLVLCIQQKKDWSSRLFLFHTVEGSLRRVLTYITNEYTAATACTTKEYIDTLYSLSRLYALMQRPVDLERTYADLLSCFNQLTTQNQDAARRVEIKREHERMQHISTIDKWQRNLTVFVTRMSQSGGNVVDEHHDQEYEEVVSQIHLYLAQKSDALVGRDHLRTLSIRSARGSAYTQAGRYDLAEATWKEILQRIHACTTRHASDVAQYYVDAEFAMYKHLGESHMRQGRLVEAEDLYRRAVAFADAQGFADADDDRAYRRQEALLALAAILTLPAQFCPYRSEAVTIAKALIAFVNEQEQIQRQRTQHLPPSQPLLPVHMTSNRVCAQHIVDCMQNYSELLSKLRELSTQAHVDGRLEVAEIVDKEIEVFTAWSLLPADHVENNSPPPLASMSTALDISSPNTAEQQEQKINEISLSLNTVSLASSATTSSSNEVSRTVGHSTVTITPCTTGASFSPPPAVSSTGPPAVTSSSAAFTFETSSDTSTCKATSVTPFTFTSPPLATFTATETTPVFPAFSTSPSTATSITATAADIPVNPFVFPAVPPSKAPSVPTSAVETTCNPFVFPTASATASTTSSFPLPFTSSAGTNGSSSEAFTFPAPPNANNTTNANPFAVSTSSAAASTTAPFIFQSSSPSSSAPSSSSASSSAVFTFEAFPTSTSHASHAPGSTMSNEAPKRRGVVSHHKHHTRK